jgi:hypothetical protein
MRRGIVTRAARIGAFAASGALAASPALARGPDSVERICSRGNALWRPLPAGEGKPERRDDAAMGGCAHAVRPGESSLEEEAGG